MKINGFLHRAGVIAPPKGYGFSHYRINADIEVWHPIPINYLVRIGLAALRQWNLFWLRSGIIERKYVAYDQKTHWTFSFRKK